MDEILIKPIGVIRSDFKDKFGIPRQSGRAPSLLSRVEFYPPYNRKEAFLGLDGFTHAWIIFQFSKVNENSVGLTVRPPRLGGNTRRGVFATRSPYRPNRIGLSCVKIEKIEEGEQISLLVSGADLLDGTPVLDIKPYIPFADCIPSAVGGFADEQKEHHLAVDFPPDLLSILPEDKRQAVIECIADDPRPSYHDDSRVYSMAFDQYDISFTVNDARATIIKVTKI